MWADGAHYVEESVYALRVWRYVLWTRDVEFLKTVFPTVELALKYAYNAEGYGFLINNVIGNQSYDAWKMPGIGAYVNNQWIYALYSLKQMCRILGKETVFNGTDIDEFTGKAISQYNDTLWDENRGYWLAYRPNEASEWEPFGDAVFSDQLFGHWMLNCDKNSKNVIAFDKEKNAVAKIYQNNKIPELNEKYFCWANGVLPNKDETCNSFVFNDKTYRMSHHALTCWIGTQLDLASMLAYCGFERESTDVFLNVSKGLGKNVLAAGEWNRKLGPECKAYLTNWEVGKDTPRFPPYPRYKSSWEYIMRLLGIEMDFEHMYINPFKGLDFSFKNITVAGIKLSVTVKANWGKCYVNGKVSEPILNRNIKEAELEFL